MLGDGTAKCWGDNGQLQLGGTPSPPRTAVQVAGLTQVQEIRAGQSHTCAVRSDQTIWCWGANSYGQFGNGGSTGSVTPVPATGLVGTLSFAVGSNHVCGLFSLSVIKCAGFNNYGMLGNGSTSTSNALVNVTW